MYRTKAIYQFSDLKQSSWKILRLFAIYRQSGSQAPVVLNVQQKQLPGPVGHPEIFLNE